jgi:ankyrin repeat protein
LKGQVELSRWILEKNPSLAYKKNFLGELPIHFACMGNASELIRDFMALDENLLKLQDHQGCIPLFYLIQQEGSGQLSREILSAHPELLYIENNKKELLIHVCRPSIQGEGLMDWMVEQDFHLAERKDRSGNTLLHLLCETSHLALIDKLIKKKTSVLYQRNQLGDFPIHRAVEKSNREAVKLMVCHDRSLLTARGGLDELPIHYVKDFPLFMWMIENDPTLPEKPDGMGRTFLHHLAMAEECPSLEEILDWVVKNKPELFEVKDEFENTPLDVVDNYENFQFLSWYAKRNSVIS